MKLHSKEEFNKWLKLRKESADDCNEILCYCGHTFKCSCADPDIKSFSESVDMGTIKLNDDKNGWEEMSVTYSD